MLTRTTRNFTDERSICLSLVLELGLYATSDVYSHLLRIAQAARPVELLCSHRNTNSTSASFGWMVVLVVAATDGMNLV